MARVSACLSLLDITVSRKSAISENTGEDVYTLVGKDGLICYVTARELAHMAKQSLKWFDFPYGDPGEPAEKNEKGKVVKEAREPVRGYVGPMRDALILPCDSPYVTKKYITTIFSEIDCDYQAIVPYHDNEKKIKTSEPLHSIYNKNIIPIIENLIDSDVLHIKGLIEKIDTKFVLIDNKKIEKKEFRNLNRPSDI